MNLVNSTYGRHFFKKNEQTYTIVHVFNRVRFVAFRSQGDPNNNKN